MTGVTSGRAARLLWGLDPGVRFLNHGSYGACPTDVLAAQTEWRTRMERQPVRFFMRELEPALDHARASLAALLACNAGDLAFVTNATEGVNTALASHPLGAGDEVLVLDQGYNACRNAAVKWAARVGAYVRHVQVPFPVSSAAQLFAAFAEVIGPRTRLAVLDHITSPTALVLPVESLVPWLEEQGIATLVDGAHAPGMVPLHLDALGASYYTGNCHKWLCAPKGAAFLWVRRDRQAHLQPLATSHGFNSVRSDRSRFRLELDWTGTRDPSAWLCVPVAIDWMARLAPGGLSQVQRHNHELALAGAALVSERLSVSAAAPEDMIGSMVTISLPQREDLAFDAAAGLYDLQNRLLHQWDIEVPIVPWPDHRRAWVRISAQVYNERDEYAALAEALASELGCA
jgi:isopenicillin-N epimerase